MTEITTEKSTFLKRIVFMRFENRAHAANDGDSVKFSESGRGVLAIPLQNNKTTLEM